MRIPEKEIEKVCKWAFRVVYLFKLNVPITDIPDGDFAYIKYCWSYGDYVLCPDKWCQCDVIRNLKGLTYLGQIECR